jgi:hypothetical protein
MKVVYAELDVAGPEMLELLEAMIKSTGEEKRGRHDVKAIFNGKVAVEW